MATSTSSKLSGRCRSGLDDDTISDRAIAAVIMAIVVLSSIVLPLADFAYT